MNGTFKSHVPAYVWKDDLIGSGGEVLAVTGIEVLVETGVEVLVGTEGEEVRGCRFAIRAAEYLLGKVSFVGRVIVSVYKGSACSSSSNERPHSGSETGVSDTLAAFISRCSRGMGSWEQSDLPIFVAHSEYQWSRL